MTSRLALACLLLSPLLGMDRFAITGVTLIDPATRTVAPNMTVEVAQGVIAAIYPGPPAAGQRRRLVEAKGKFLIPGLWDAHVHLSKAGIHTLGVFLANGVTSVRDMGSDPHEVLAWRRQIAMGAMAGPRIYAAGPILESAENVQRMKRSGTVEPVDRIRVAVANPTEARAAVERLVASGVDHIKMRTAPDTETFLAVVARTRELGKPVAAHPLLAAEELPRSGLASIEHGVAFLPLGTTAASRRDTFTRLGSAGVSVATTLVNYEAFLMLSQDRARQLLADQSGSHDARRRIVGSYLLKDWQEQVDERDGTEPVPSAVLNGLFRDFREMRESQVRLMPGTDVAVAFMYPGFSLHDELRIYVERLGFSPMEALRAAVVNPALFYGLPARLVPGQRADLVLLDRNPLEEIGNTKSIAGVSAAGRWFDRSRLRSLIRSAERRAQKPRNG